MDVSDYIGFVASEGDRFAAAAEQGVLSADIPPCEGWDMRELVRHLGLIHLRAAANVAFPTPLTMWSRRQASEIAIHRFDAEVSRGIPTHFEPRFAADMLDELVSGFAPGPREIPVRSERVLHIHAHDVDEPWYVTIDPHGMETSRQGGDADLTVTGTAAELYLLLWNRTADSSVTLTGDTDLMDLWRGHCRVRWSGA